MRLGEAPMRLDRGAGQSRAADARPSGARRLRQRAGPCLTRCCQRARHTARARTASSISAVRRPVNVFCWLGSQSLHPRPAGSGSEPGYGHLSAGGTRHKVVGQTRGSDGGIIASSA